MRRGNKGAFKNALLTSYFLNILLLIGDLMDERDDINKYREKQKRKKTITRLVIFVVVTTALLLIVINWKSILKPFKDIGSRAGEGGFPIDLTSSANYVLGNIGENIYLLTDTYLYTYNGDGAELSDNQHGFQNPACSSNEKRVLAYDRNGKDIKVYSRNSEIFSKSFEDTIVFAQMGTEERSAVVTTSSRYANYLYVLNAEGRQIFRWASPDEKIMQVCFSDDEKSIFVSVVGEENGALESSVMRFDTGDTELESELWRAAIGSSVSYSLECRDDGVYAVTPEGAFLIDKKTGEITASNSYSKEISGIAQSDGMTVTLFRDTVSNGETAVAYNESLESSSSVSLENLSAFKVSGGKLYTLCESRLTVYGGSLAVLDEYDLDDEYSDMEIYDKYVYLLGYNKVQRLEVRG